MQMELFDTQKECCENCRYGGEGVNGKKFYCFRRCDDNGTTEVKKTDWCKFYLEKGVDWFKQAVNPCPWEGLPCPHSKLCPLPSVEIVVVRKKGELPVIGEMMFCDKYKKETHFKIYGSLENPYLLCREVWESSYLCISDYKWNEENPAFFTEKGVYHICNTDRTMPKDLKKCWHDTLEKMREK